MADEKEAGGNLAEIERAEAAEPAQSLGPPHSVFSKRAKVTYVYVASLAAFVSPVSTSIYYPAMVTLATDLNTSYSNITLSVTTYMIFQGVAPTFVGGISDRYGRRPAYLISFAVFVAANIGLALQTNYTALLILRCVQSCGSSGTAALSSAVVSDVATRQQRGSYIGLSALGSSMGPALGPIIGGLLNWYLGWRAIFWFLAIYGAIMWLAYFLFIPESCRNIVGNGSLPAQCWNRPIIDLIRKKKDTKPDFPASEITIKKRPGIMSTIPIICEKESFLTLWFGGIMYAGYYIVLTSLPEQLASTYHYNALQVGLCYLPIGFGPLLMRPIVGRIMDRNFRRHARKLGIPIIKNRQTDTEDFPIERARLEISLICVYLSGLSVLPYGWVMGLPHPPLPAALALLFIMGACQSGAFQPLTALIIDLNPTSAGAATAAFNFVRCILGAAGVAAGHPMTQKLGRGLTSTVIACVWALMSLSWWAVVIWGPKWRKARVAKLKEKEHDIN